MKDKIFKVLKFITSRMFFLILGIGLVFGIYMAKAAWNNTVVGGADTLTATRWNDMVAKLIELDGRKQWGGTYSVHNGVCRDVNSITGDCSCPVGFLTYDLALDVCRSSGDVCTVGDYLDIFGCYK